MTRRLAVAIALTTAACAPQAVPVAAPEAKPHPVVVVEAIDPTAGVEVALAAAVVVEPRHVHARAGRSRVRPRPALLSQRGGGGCTLEVIRRRESGNDYGAVSASGKYRGAYQFDASTWRSVGGSGDPAAASPDEQDARAAALMARRGTQPWSVCR